jgi:hypothetical protein
MLESNLATEPLYVAVSRMEFEKRGVGNTRGMWGSEVGISDFGFLSVDLIQSLCSGERCLGSIQYHVDQRRDSFGF